MNTKDNWQTTATIHDPNRRAIWGTIFLNAVVPIKSMAPVRAELPGYPEALVYFLDLDAISEEQLEQIVKMVCKLFGMDEDEVRQDIAERGVPILADGVAVETREDSHARMS